MLVAEIYKFENDCRMTESKEFEDREALDKHLMTLILQGIWVGHKIYAVGLKQYYGFTGVERATAVVEQKFDKESYIKNRRGK